ncbi:MAG TPA: phage portal protein [Vicinamibacterales bacterium]|nr:phage portal protein [Vicinamibacterales bacterium]
MGVLARLHDRRSSWLGPLSSWTDDKIIAKYSGAIGAKTQAGIVVTPELAFTFSAVYDAVNQISSDVAKLPLNLLKRDKDGGSEQHTASKTYKLLKFRPNPEQTTMVFRRTITAHALTCKGGFAEIERDGMGRPAALWLIEPHRIEAIREKNGPLQWRVDGTEILPDRDVIHLQGLGYDGINAYPLITFARQAIGLALAAESFSASFFGNGLQYGGILTSDQPWDEEEAGRAKAILEQMVGGPEAAHQLIALWGGMKLEKTGVEPDKAQMDATRTKQVEEVARFFNMPLHKLKSLERSTNNNIEQQDLEYYKGCLLNWVTLWEQELQAKLIPELEWSQQFFKHNDKAFLRGDAAARTALYSALLDRGVYNADMVLELEDMNPQPSGQGQLYLVNSTMVPKDKIQALADANIQGKTAPPAPPSASDTAAADDRATRAEQAARDAAEQASVLRAQLAAAEATGTAHADTLTGLRSHLDAQTTLASRLAHEAETIRKEATDLAEALAKEQRERAAEQATFLGERTALTTERDTANAAIAALTSERDAIAATATAAAADADALRASLEEKSAEVAEVTLALRDVQAAQADAVTRSAEAQALVDALTREARTAEALVTQAAETVETMTAAAEEARRLAADADARAQAATTDKADAIAKAETLAAEALRATQRAAEALSDQVALTARLEMAESTRDVARRDRDEAAENAITLTAQIETLHASLAAAETARSAAEAALTEARTALEDEQQKRQAAENALIAADERAADAATALAAETSALAAEESRTADAILAKSAAEAAAETAKRLAVEQLEAHRVTEAHAHTLKQQLTVQHEAQAAMTAAVLTASRALVADVMRRMVGRETDRLRRAQASPSKLRTAIGQFYDDHRDLLASALVPALRVHLAATGDPDDPAVIADGLAAEYVASSLRDLDVVLATDPVEEFSAVLDKRLQQWERDRPDAVADRIFSQALGRRSGRAS